MGMELKIGKEDISKLGVAADRILSPGFELARFELCLRDEAPGSSMEILITGPGTDERREVETDKIIAAVSDAFKGMGLPELSDGLRSLFKDSEQTLNGKPIQVTDDWLK